MPDSLADLAHQLNQFAADRDWQAFHSPKNLASALIVEAGELLEHFQWLTEDGSRQLAPEPRRLVAAEMADVLLYLIQLGIDPVAAAQDKLRLNALRYPVATARGNSRKHTAPAPEVAAPTPEVAAPAPDGPGVAAPAGRPR